ncbi:DUF1697 domain-containing protein [Nemorincola caseinilytica]|uniref:DUF1697 domain-containing protein n=2 Tax=Nemorincola caseinilytica TaxID=2054315 RepID=A0ABP8NPA5_9BACT
MTRYIAFLRAINVGGRTVKMEDLRQHFAMPGLKNISTYIQSGNVIFEHSSTDVPALTAKIEARMLKTLGYEVKTFLKTPPELQAIVADTPFKDIPADMAQHVSFLSAVPAKEAVEQLLQFQNENEQFHIVGTDVYILVKKGAYGMTKFSNNFLEKKLKVAATTRNWATISKLAQI